jgi:ankyrin repeat protein
MAPLVHNVSNAQAASAVWSTPTSANSNVKHEHQEEKEQVVIAAQPIIDTHILPSHETPYPAVHQSSPYHPLSPRTPSDEDKRWLQTAIDGDIATMHKMLDHLDNDINCVDEWGSTALMLACYHDHTSCVRMLLDEGANIDLQDHRGVTCLMETSWNCNIELVHMLLHADVPPNVNIVDDRGYSAITQAAEEGFDEVVVLLIEAGAGVNVRDKHYRASALMYAAAQGHLTVVRMLHAAGADLNHRAQSCCLCCGELLDIDVDTATNQRTGA